MASVEETRQAGRIELLAAMDTIVHHFNDEEAVAPWLEYGVPDDVDHSAFPKDPDGKRAELEDLYGEISDEEFCQHLHLFMTLMNEQCYVKKIAKRAFY